MGKRVSWLAAAIAGAILIPMAPANAQDWNSEWDKVVAAANAEGALVLDSQPNIEMRKYVQEEWAKAYPKIALSVSTTPGTQFLARIRTERSVDKYLWDVSVSSVTTAYTLYHEGILDPLQPEFILPDVKDPEGRVSHALELSATDLNPIVLYIDLESSLILKRLYTADAPGRPVIEEEFHEYRAVDGIQFAFHATQRVGSLSVDRRVTDVKLNSTLDPALFKRPAS